MLEKLLLDLGYRLTRSDYGRFRGLSKKYGKSSVEQSIMRIKELKEVDYSKLLGLIEYYCQRNTGEEKIEEIEKYL